MTRILHLRQRTSALAHTGVSGCPSSGGIMLFFRGWGFLLIPAFFVVGVIVAALISLLGEPYRLIGGAVGGIVGGALLWWVGSRLNDPSKDQVLVDARTGKKVVVKK